ncbi:MAG: hypothetical protein ACTSSI_08825 [Candidatus Helarchaeota archaeon]
MVFHSFGEIPDNIRFKPYMPLYPNAWKIFQTFGMERFHDFCLNSRDGCYSFFETRFNECIDTTRRIMSDSLQHPEKTLSYVLVLPNVVMRSDLMQGVQRLFLGDSVDITYIILKYDTQEVFGLLNGHLEEGLPVDYWFIPPDDELLERRHLKLGYKIKDIPKKIKDMRKSSARLIDIFKDIRNERTPEWSTANYSVINAYETFALNLLYEPSSYENSCQGFDGWAAKELYKLPDYAFALYPWPTMINTFLYQGRKEFTKKLTGMCSKFYISTFEKENKEMIVEQMPHVFEWYVREKLDKGVPFPIQTLECQMPNIKNKKDPDVRFEYQYPPSEWIDLDNLGISRDEFTEGVFLDIDHETKVEEKIDKSRIISLGIGKQTRFLN